MVWLTHLIAFSLFASNFVQKIFSSNTCFPWSVLSFIFDRAIFGTVETYSHYLYIKLFKTQLYRLLISFNKSRYVLLDLILAKEAKFSRSIIPSFDESWSKIYPLQSIHGKQKTLKINLIFLLKPFYDNPTRK